jgi:ABC-type sugar transport system ATPase subunit
MPLIELQNVDLKLGGTPILHDLCFQLKQRERMVILGQSGAGKSSLLRVLAGLVDPTQGRILLDGQPLNRIAYASRRIALLGQDYALYPQMTIQKNLEIGLKPLKLGRAQTSCRIEEIAEQFEISELLFRLPSEISGGQAQRAAFAKALVKQPLLLLLDEPLSQLDARLRQQILRTTLALAEQHAIAVCWVAHDLWEAFQIASRIIVIDGGKILQDGMPEEIYRTPGCSLVAELCSPWGINWLPLNLPELESLRPLAPKGAGQVGIRPEDCQMLGGGKLIPLSVRIERHQFVGFATMAFGMIGQYPFVFLSRDGSHQKSDHVRIGVAPDRILWKPSARTTTGRSSGSELLLYSNSAVDH